MKVNKTMGWLLVIFVIAPCTVMLINLLFFPENGDAEKYVADYIDNSVEIEFDPEEHNKDGNFNTTRVYTGLRTAFLRGKLSGATIRNYRFFSDKYQKYFCFSIIPGKRAQAEAYDATMREKKIIVKSIVLNWKMQIMEPATIQYPYLCSKFLTKIIHHF
ncbi:MAG: hypothetical protein LBV72_19470 [Tannerella sp.]|jgi:hypothetical protein|nr:hypothetical protein [Tannerella sp.]